MALVRRVGTSRDDTLFGDNGGPNLDEWFLARGGRDWVQAGLGDDRVNGERGEDRLFGDEGDDTIYGGAGNDLLDGGPGSNYLSGGPGSDTIHGGPGGGRPIQGLPPNEDIPPYQNFLIGGAGNDKLYGSPYVDELWGGAGNDELWGGGSADRPNVYAAPSDYLNGGDGNDLLVATAGSACGMQGWAGDDVIIAEYGARGGSDYTAGGNGTDHFWISDPEDYIVWGDNRYGTKDGAADYFALLSLNDSHQALLGVSDFQPGVDKVAVGIEGMTGEEVFAALDTNGNGLLGDDVSTDFGSAGWNAELNAVEITVGYQTEGDTLTVYGVETVAASDWF